MTHGNRKQITIPIDFEILQQLNKLSAYFKQSRAVTIRNLITREWAYIEKFYNSPIKK